MSLPAKIVIRSDALCLKITEIEAREHPYMRYWRNERYLIVIGTEQVGDGGALRHDTVPYQTRVTHLRNYSRWEVAISCKNCDFWKTYVNGKPFSGILLQFAPRKSGP